jgi:hypothetical protein
MKDSGIAPLIEKMPPNGPFSEDVVMKDPGIAPLME